MEKFIFFWKTSEKYGCFSNWYTGAEFTHKGKLMKNSEVGMMWGKAMLFNDIVSAELILKAKTAKDAKALGRGVSNFDKNIWEANCKQIVYDVCKDKFQQHPKLLDLLLETKEHTLVEASPMDQIWGIGLAADHKDASNRSKWRGTNYLGEVLTKLRDDILNERIN